MIKLIAIDLDGTLLNSKKEISAANKETLAKAKAAGVKVVICTGRPLKAIHHILDELNLEEPGDYAVTFNGGLVQKNDTGEVMAKSALKMADIAYLYETIHPLGLPMDVISDTVVFQLPSEHASLYKEANPFMDFYDGTVETLEQNRVYNKAISAVAATFLDEQIAKFPAEVRERFEVIKSRDMLLEFMPKGVTKAVGIDLLAKHLGITSEEVMTLGDEENDLPMIDYAGVGVAMGNAVPAIKAAANVETDTNDNDGVAKAVEKYVLAPLGK
jgi:Cof subfamily protein (haloacid dehalogenase superfamily)